MYYKVRLLKLKNNNEKDSPYQYDIEYLGDIIVARNLLTVKEIMTNLKITVVQEEDYEDTKKLRDYTSIFAKDLAEYGFKFFTLDSDFCKRNKITEKELEEYINRFENSKFKWDYDKMKRQTRKTKRKIKAKIKTVRGKYE